MINAINVLGGIKLQENPEIKKERETETPPEAIMLISDKERGYSRKQIDYKSKYERSVNKWYRHNVGTYPKKFARIVTRIAKFAFKFTPYKLEVLLRGRGSRKECRELMIKEGKLSPFMIAYRLQSDLSVKYAKKVAVYVTIYRKEHNG